MGLKVIRLQGGEWEIDENHPLGKPGGFGEVFHGFGPDGEVAIKRLKLDVAQAAHRELTIGKKLMERSLSYVVPIIDAGQDTESGRYFLVMPICDFSLQDKMDEDSELLELEVAGIVILSIIRGLLEVHDITHRDLKPANILFHEGRWKIADFGIAKFVEDSTSMKTLRNSLTPTYAAPEQWLGERPTTATDVYALGCIMHALFRGRPPFSGAGDDIRESHLHEVPPIIESLPPKLSAFVSQMLRKRQKARPSLERCADVLTGVNSTFEKKSGVHTSLEHAAKQVAETEAIEEAQHQLEMTLQQEREELYADAKDELIAIKGRLFAHIKNTAESARIDHQERVCFGSSVFSFSQGPEMLCRVSASIHGKDGELYHNSGWDVLGWAIISVICKEKQRRKAYEWSASLLYADRKDGHGFRWYEVSFWMHGRSRGDVPYGLCGYERDIDLALGAGMHTVNVAYGPLPIDGEDEEEFILRWTKLVAQAAIGELQSPNAMPMSSFR